MVYRFRWVALFTLLLAMLVATGCEDAAEEALEEATGLDWELSEDDFLADTGINTPDDWYFMFAVDLTEEQTSLMDQDFEADLSLLEDLIDFSDVQYQVVFAHADALPNGNGNGLRYANKVLIQDNKIMLDSEALAKLGESIGPSGPGWYACYFSMVPVGYVKGEVTDCDGAAPPANTVLVTASDGPFFTFAAANGSWALPSIDGKPAMVNFDAGDCAASDAAPVTDTEEDPNPKDPGTEPENDPFGSDDSNVVDAGETDMSEDDPAGGTTGNGDRFEFDDGEAAWGNTGDCFTIVTDADDYDTLFPAGTDAAQAFGYISTGSPSQSTQACTVMRTFNVEGYSKVRVSYDFLSQEYPEWVGSAYNDIFTFLIQGETGYVVHRTINGENNWEAFSGDAGDIGFIGSSVDASSPMVLDGHLKWEGNSSPRGEDDTNNVIGTVAEYDLPAGATTITILITVSDVADAIYDSVAAIDYIEFE